MARLMVDSGRSPLPTPPRRLLAVFQPHRFSRTSEFLDDFARSLVDCDRLLLAPVFSAGEQPINNVNSHTLADRVRTLKPQLEVDVADSMTQLVELIRECSLPDDLVLAMGAGDVNGIWPILASSDQASAAAVAA